MGNSGFMKAVLVSCVQAQGQVVKIMCNPPGNLCVRRLESCVSTCGRFSRTYNLLFLLLVPFATLHSLLLSHTLYNGDNRF